MIVTGIVYNLLLRGIENPSTVVAWADEVLHLIGPALLLADVLFAPRRRPLRWAAIWAIIAFPLAWSVYTLLRANTITAPATGNAWRYPYPFLDPHLQGGYGGVALYIAAITVCFTAVAAAIVWASRARASRR